ncbi:MAG TPA: hypothetical protein VLM79_14565 [Kofleriaceae bacterium]|nr:hypothetical protein [Kofleriaceae bacterium]
MIRVRRIASYVLALLALWLVALVVMNAALADRTSRRVAERLGDSLESKATIDDAQLALVRGHLDLEGLALRRDDLIGHLAITAASVHCELPPLGLALVDRDCRRLLVRQTRLEVSTAALFKLHRPKRPPLHVRNLVIEDARLEFSPSAFLPSLGRIAIAIERAEAGPTVLKTPLSWIFSLRELRATLELPGGVTLRLVYEGGQLQVSGGMFGVTPVALPVALPVADIADDAGAEIAKLIAFGKDLAQRLVLGKAEDWLRSKLPWP